MLWEVFFATTNKKLIRVGGDIKIDLLNPNKHKATDELINAVFSMSLIPLITKPRRITSHSATLIDKIFTNHMNNSLWSGLLMNNISDIYR